MAGRGSLAIRICKEEEEEDGEAAALLSPRKKSEAHSQNSFFSKIKHLAPFRGTGAKMGTHFLSKCLFRDRAKKSLLPFPLCLLRAQQAKRTDDVDD